jgi:hypothetical protein
MGASKDLTARIGPAAFSMHQPEGPFIYHLVLESEFHLWTADDFYKPARFETDGFIHCTPQKKRH